MRHNMLRVEQNAAEAQAIREEINEAWKALEPEVEAVFSLIAAHDKGNPHIITPEQLEAAHRGIVP